MPRALSDEEQREAESLIRELREGLTGLRVGLESIQTELGEMQMHDEEGREVTFDDERLDRWLEHLNSQSISETIGDLLTLHKLAEQWSEHYGVGRVRFFLAIEAATMLPLLEMLAPVELEEASAAWERPHLSLVEGGGDA